MKTLQKCEGFTLIEVVVAMGVMSVGLLGLASLQATSLKLNQSALLRTQATNLAYNVIDAMLANKAGVINDEYNQNLPITPHGFVQDYILDTSTIANQDLQTWNNALAYTLPQGAGGIMRNGNTITIVVEWNDSQNAEERQTFVTVTNIQ